MFCKNCGAEIDNNAAVCPQCGVATAAAPAASSDYLAGKDEFTIAAICYFFGGFGIHNFMMGESKKGILKIVLTLCTGLGGIFGVLDFIKIVLHKYEVNPDKFF